MSSMFPLCLSIFLAPGRSVMQICLLSESETEMPAKHPGYFFQRYPCHRRPPAARAKVSSGSSLPFAARQRDTDQLV